MTLATTSLVVERQYDIGYNFDGSGKAVLLWLQLRWLWKGNMILATTSLAVERQYYSGYNFAGSGKAVERQYDNGYNSFDIKAGGNMGNLYVT